METATATATAIPTTDQPPPQAAEKLRLMCSYGGRIVPVPYKQKSLFYAGGDTRIISIPFSSASSSLAAFSSHIDSVLQVGYPFTLKYQLPLQELDSLVSLATDEDLIIFLEELQRPSIGRIRLFLFPAESTHGLTHPKTESWFIDALKSAKIMQSGGEIGGESGGGLCGQESMLLETTSSFGSSSSSVSLSNLPPIKACGDDNKTFFPLTDSIARYLQPL